MNKVWIVMCVNSDGMECWQSVAAVCLTEEYANNLRAISNTEEDNDDVSYHVEQFRVYQGD